MKKAADLLPEIKPNLGGRPTKWYPGVNQELIEYFAVAPSRVQEVTMTDRKGNESTRTEVVAERFPTFERFAHNHDVNVDTLIEWAKEEHLDDYPGFSGAYRRAKELQKDFLLENALSGRFNPQFSIFFAKNNLGMKDKTEVDSEVTVKGYAVVPGKESNVD